MKARRLVVALGALMTTAVIAFGTSPARAAAPIDGMGTVGTCKTTGKIKIKPGLVNGGTTPAALKIKAAAATCSGGTGDGTSITTAKAKGTGTTVNNDCASLVGMQPAMISLTVKWKGSKKLNPSVISITNQTGGVTGDGHGSFDVTGTVVMGSFAGDNVSAHVETDQTVMQILTACGAKGLKKISFGANNLSTITIN